MPLTDGSVYQACDVAERGDVDSQAARISGSGGLPYGQRAGGVVPWPMPDLTIISSRFRVAPALCPLELQRGYWHMSLAEASQDLFSIVGTSGLYTLTKVPQGILNATAFSPFD